MILQGVKLDPEWLIVSDFCGKIRMKGDVRANVRVWSEEMQKGQSDTVDESSGATQGRGC